MIDDGAKEKQISVEVILLKDAKNLICSLAGFFYSAIESRPPML